MNTVLLSYHNADDELMIFLACLVLVLVLMLVLVPNHTTVDDPFFTRLH